MRIVEADEPLAIRCMQRERVGQAMRPLPRRVDASDRETDPIPAFEMMNVAIEGQEELKTVISVALGHFISSDDMFVHSERC